MSQTLSASERNSTGVDESTPVAVVTGAGSGIGAAIALRFAAEGWDVVLIGRRQEALNQTRSLICEATGKSSQRVTVLPLDVANVASVGILIHWIQMSESVSNRTQCIVHNAGIYERAATLTATDASWHRIFETNVFAVIRMTQALYPCLKRNRGSVIAISSTLGLRPVPDTGAYSASKAALNNWIQTFALECAPDGVRANSVCPGIVDTPIHSFHSAPDKNEVLQSMAKLQPLGRVGKPEDIANMVWHLAGPGSEWTTGALIPVDGGISLL